MGHECQSPGNRRSYLRPMEGEGMLEVQKVSRFLCWQHSSLGLGSTCRIGPKSSGSSSLVSQLCTTLVVSEWSYCVKDSDLIWFDSETGVFEITTPPVEGRM